MVAGAFLLELNEMEDGFTFDGKYMHPTYPGFVPPPVLHDARRRLTSIELEGSSIVHEVSKDGYEHTHVLWMFKERVRFKGCNKLDVAFTNEHGAHVVKHPNIARITSYKQCETVMLNYHRGRKLDPETGKLAFTEEPAFIEQWLPPAFEFTAAIIREVIDAESLAEAACKAECRPRSILDCDKLRLDAAQQPKKFCSKFDRDTFKDLLSMADISPDWNVLWAYGPTGVGKTKWALVQGDKEKSPLHVKPFDSIGALEKIKKQFNPNLHDLIVCDEADLSKFMTREMVIAFFDADDDATINCRFSSFELPPVRKILLSNEPPAKLLPTDHTGAIDRRFVELNINTKTYYEPGLPIPGWQPITTTQPTQPSPATAPRQPLTAVATPNAVVPPQLVTPVRQFTIPTPPGYTAPFVPRGF